MPTAAPPAWLEAAATAEAPPADRVPLAKPAPILKVSLTTPPEAEEPEADGIETDAGRGGYAARTMLPSFAACVLVTAGWGLIDRAWLPRWLPLWAAFAPVAALWLLQAVRWGYRTAFLSFRLTTRRLFRDQGGLYPREDALDLAAVARAEVLQDPVERLLGVGRVRVVPQPEGVPDVVLTGIWRPRRLAAQIELLAQAARARSEFRDASQKRPA